MSYIIWVAYINKLCIARYLGREERKCRITKLPILFILFNPLHLCNRAVDAEKIGR